MIRLESNRDPDTYGETFIRELAVGTVVVLTIMFKSTSSFNRSYGSNFNSYFKLNFNFPESEVPNLPSWRKIQIQTQHNLKIQNELSEFEI